MLNLEVNDRELREILVESQVIAIVGDLLRPDQVNHPSDGFDLRG
jgi:hypothetical protein